MRVAYLEGDDADQDAGDEEDEGDDEPDDTPHFGFFLKFVKEGASDQHVLAQIKRYWAYLVKGNSHRSSRRLMHQKHLLSGR